MRVGLGLATVSTIVWLTFLNGLLFGLDQLGWLRSIRAPLEQVAIPVQDRLAKLGQVVVTELSGPLKARRQYQNRVALEEEISTLVAENTKLRLRISELESQQQLEEVLPQATILQASVVEVGEKLVLDKGKNDGVSKGVTVTVGELLVGKVSSLTPHTALVSLITDPEVKLPVIVVDQSGSFGPEQTRGLALGRFHQDIELTQVLASEEIREGQLVVSAGGAGVPRHLVIGRISEVQRQEAEIFATASVKTMIDYKRLSNVSIILTAEE